MVGVIFSHMKQPGDFFYMQIWRDSTLEQHRISCSKSQAKNCSVKQGVGILGFDNCFFWFSFVPTQDCNNNMVEASTIEKSLWSPRNQGSSIQTIPWEYHRYIQAHRWAERKTHACTLTWYSPSRSSPYLPVDQDLRYTYYSPLNKEHNVDITHEYIN